MSTPTAYIVTPINTPPEKAGWYDMALTDGSIPNCPTYFDGKEFVQHNPKHTHWLKPVDLSRMLEEAFRAGEYRGAGGYPDRKTYINNVINPQK